MRHAATICHRERLDLFRKLFHTSMPHLPFQNRFVAAFFGAFRKYSLETPRPAAATSLTGHRCSARRESVRFAERSARGRGGFQFGGTSILSGAAHLLSEVQRSRRVALRSRRMRLADDRYASFDYGPANTTGPPLRMLHSLLPPKLNRTRAGAAACQRAGGGL
ncbi:MAG: hypothetical protein QG637_1451 [Chloroflexota bacterium]|nr:hypothetical protein [Chloroflexota bacterium]